MLKILESHFGNSNCFIESDKYYEFLEFNERETYEVEYQNLTTKIGLDYLYVVKKENFKRVKFYKDKLPLLKQRKKIKYLIK